MLRIFAVIGSLHRESVTRTVINHAAKQLESDGCSMDVLDLEKEHLGATHIVAGARLLQDWRLPDGIWQTIAQVQLPPAPGETFPSGRIPAARVLGIADLTASLLCETREGGPEAVQNAIKLALETFDLGEEAWAKVYEEVSADWRVYGQLLSVKAGTTKSFAALQEEARDQITALTLATHLENLGIKEQNQQLLQQTRIDGMTGISNRVAFDERLASELERARRTKRPLVLCMLDVDHFKKFNDTHGHQVGDKVLQAVAKSLDDTIRKMDLVARYGGEEFVVIAPECSPSSIGLLAERLRAAVSENALKINDQTLQITVSVGVAFAQWDQYPRTATELIEAADGRLYEAKRAGRNCCKFEPELSKAA